MTEASDTGLRQKLQRVEELIQKIDAIADPAVRAYISETIQTILDFHGAGMSRIMEHLSRRENGQSLIRDIARDEIIGSLLLLYDLHPLDLAARVTQAVAGLQPEMRKHGLAVELVGVEGPVVRTRITGTVHGCHSSLPAVQQTVRDAVSAVAPEAEAVEVEDATASPGKQFVSLTASAAVHQPAPADAAL